MEQIYCKTIIAKIKLNNETSLLQDYNSKNKIKQ
jgi:hypothetical protein